MNILICLEYCTMRTKTTINFVSQFSRSVLHDITSKNKVRHTRLEPAIRSFKQPSRTIPGTQLTTRLPSAPDLIYRGSMGTKEIIYVLETNYLGTESSVSRKSSSLDIVEYIRENDSKYFLSFSPCKETVKPYAAGLSMLPCKGYIIVTGLPKVYTIPQKLLHLNRDIFSAYNHQQQDKISRANAEGITHAFEDIIDMTANNNEITAVLYSSAQEDWRPVVSEDLMSIFEVSGPGRILSQFMSATQIAYLREWDNPDFTKRIYALEIVLYGHDPRDLAIMNDNAHETRLITKDERLITLDDARTVINSGELDKLNALYTTTETQRIASVPKSIAIGDQNALVEYMTAKLKECPLLIDKKYAAKIM